ncbi:MAG: glycoside hydrolase family 20 zincin-like fold domain-containing protein [Terriglobia bacterium]
MRFFTQRSSNALGVILCVLVFGPPCARAATASPLYARGYTVIPQPQQVELQGPDFEFGAGWRIELGPGVSAGDVAVESLRKEMLSRHGIALGGRAQGKPIELVIRPGSVEIGKALDKNRAALEKQAYRLELASDAIHLTANAPTGLFYGVDTLMQLVKPAKGKLWLPAGTITDWPDLELRSILWDDTFHLEHLDVLKAAIRRAAFYKINGFTLKLCGHFQFKSAPAVVEPYALSPAQYQELTDYGLKYHVQLIPYLDAPAHETAILKHPEYAALREFPQSNYEFCATNPKTYSLLEAMFQNLMDANKDSHYILLSTDEPYYVGIAKNAQCDEVDEARQLGGRGRLLAQFTTKLAQYLHDRGRTVIFWGEYPLTPKEIPSLPSYLVNGEVYGPEFDPAFKAHGIRQMIYTYTGGALEFPLFPDYYWLPNPDRLHPQPMVAGRVPQMLDYISFNPAREQADLMGALVAGWRDPGLHPETYWLGYITGLSYAWHPAAPIPQQATSSFFHLFYGPSALGMGRIYELMSQQAQFWNDSWETVASSARTPIFGNSYEIFKPPRPAHIQTLPPLPIPSPGILTLGSDWSRENATLLNLAQKALAGNDMLINLLESNLRRPEFNRYNLMVFLSIARLCRQNLDMLLDMGEISNSLTSAQQAASVGQAAEALSDVDLALDAAQKIWQERNATFQDTVSTWYQSWDPRVREANGRRHLFVLDSAKDSPADRTVDMSYLIYRELHFPLDEWYNRVEAARNQYAKQHGLSTRTDKLNWEDYHPVVQ